MPRITTSIKIKQEVWKEFKKHCIDKEVDYSVMLERLIEKLLRRVK